MLEGLKDNKFVVIGDVIIDYYRHLNPVKISPEAPVIVFSEGLKEYRPGGAANVAANVAAMTGATVKLFGVIGYDWESSLLPWDKYDIEGFLVVDDSRQTMVKERLVNQKQQVARVDPPINGYVPENIKKKLLGNIIPELKGADAVLFSDYCHGSLSPELCQKVIELVPDGVPIVVDTKSKDSDKYRGATIALPNDKEARVLVGDEDPGDEGILAAMVRMVLGVSAVGMTLGSRGILFDDGRRRLFPSLDVGERAIDATGAGDVVTASVGAALVSGLTMEESMAVANIAAGISVTKWGTSVVQRNELEERISSDFKSMKEARKWPSK